LQSGWKGIKDWASNAWDKASSGVSDMVNKGVDYVKNTDAYKAAAGAVNTGISAAKSAGQWIEKTYSASAQAIKDALLKAMAAAGIKTPQEQAMFMAQMDHESGGFKSLKENLHYSAANLMKTFGKKHFPTMDAAQSAVQGGERAIADAAYGGRMGNTEADDGYKYRGRGVVQLTGKANYARYGKLIGVDLVSNPDLAAEPATAAKLAIAYWKDRVKGAGTSGDVRAATLAINGGLNGLSSREAKYQQYLQQAQAGKLVPSGGAAPGTDTQTTDTNASSAGNSAGGDVKTAASDTGSGGTKNPIGMPVSDTSSGTAGKDAIKTASAGGIIPAAAPTGGNSPLSSVTDSPFGFGGSSAKPIATGTRNIMAVQQAQHDAHMDAVGGVGDTLDKSLKVHEDTLDTLKAILAVMKSQGKTARDDSSADASAAQPNSTPADVPRRPRQDMPKSPVSMRKMV
jgi:predicted chitinase